MEMDIHSLSLEVFGIDSRMGRHLLTINKERSNFKLINSFFKKLKKYINYDILFNYYQPILKTRDIILNDSTYIRMMIELIKPSRFLELTVSTSYIIEEHCYSYLLLIYKKNGKIPKFKGYKNLNDFRLKLEEVEMLHSIKDFPLNQTNLLKFENTFLGQYKIIVPKTKHELIKIGNDFKFCIGKEEQYGMNLTMPEFGFFALYTENNKPYAGFYINFLYKTIISAYGVCNHHVDIFLKHRVRQEILGENPYLTKINHPTYQKMEYNPYSFTVKLIDYNGKVSIFHEPSHEIILMIENGLPHNIFNNYINIWKRREYPFYNLYMFVKEHFYNTLKYWRNIISLNLFLLLLYTFFTTIITELPESYYMRFILHINIYYILIIVIKNHYKIK